MANKQSPIVITLTIYPLDKATKQRPAVISGARDGDMPIMHSTTFAGLHPAINQVWAELIARGEQPITVASTDTTGTRAAHDEPPAGDPPAPPAPADDQLVASSAPLLSSIDTTAPAAQAVLVPTEEPSDDTN